jgi:hypothetical protein
MITMRRALLVLAVAVGFSVAGCSKNSGIPSTHRTTAVACPEPRPPGAVTFGNGYSCQDVPPETQPQCVTDQDCDSGLNGRCACSVVVTSDQVFGECTYDSCTSDNNCDGGVCNCDSNQGNACVGGNCRTDSDCGDGGYCSGSPGGCGGATVGYFCHTPSDQCVNNQDCSGNVCFYSPSAKHWICSTCQPDG